MSAEKNRILFSRGFEVLTDDDKEMYNSFVVRCPFQLSACAAFSSVIGWSFAAKPYYKKIGESLLLVFNDGGNDNWIAFPPLCDFSHGALEAALNEYKALFSELSVPMRLYHVKPAMLPFFEQTGRRFTVKTDEALSDYIYSVQGFASSLETTDARYNLRYIQRRFEPVAETLSRENIGDFLEFFKEIWCPFHTCEDCIYGCMHEALYTMLCDSRQTGLQAFLVRAQEGVIAYAGYEICGRELVFLIKKVNRKVKGITEFVHSEVLRRSEGLIDTVNYTEDMGNEGMRHFKQKLAPYELSHNIELIFLEDLS